MIINKHIFSIINTNRSYKDYKCINCGLIIWESNFKLGTFYTEQIIYIMDDKLMCDDYIIKKILT